MFLLSQKLNRTSYIAQIFFLRQLRMAKFNTACAPGSVKKTLAELF